jgi:hypothetical protein
VSDNFSPGEVPECFESQWQFCGSSFLGTAKKIPPLYTSLAGVEALPFETCRAYIQNPLLVTCKPGKKEITLGMKTSGDVDWPWTWQIRWLPP